MNKAQADGPETTTQPLTATTPPLLLLHRVEPYHRIKITLNGNFMD